MPITIKDKLTKIKESLDGIHVASILHYIGYRLYHGNKFKLREEERTPSASIRADGYIKDFGGDFSGDLIALLQEYHNMSFNEAVDYIAVCLGVSDEST